MLSSDRWSPDADGSYYIDRNPELFAIIIEYLRSGKINEQKLNTIPEEDLKSEFDFFLIDFPEEPPVFIGGDLLSDQYKRQFATWLPKKNFTLLYKASEEGAFNPKVFHRKCDKSGPTLTIAASEDGYLFGGYTECTWGGASYKRDDTAFLFTLSNPHNLPPTRYNIKPTEARHAIYCNPAIFVAFGAYPAFEGWDLDIGEGESCSSFPQSYIDHTGLGAKTFTGTESFMTKDIEVYAVALKK